MASIILAASFVGDATWFSRASPALTSPPSLMKAGPDGKGDGFVLFAAASDKDNAARGLNTEGSRGENVFVIPLFGRARRGGRGDAGLVEVGRLTQFVLAWRGEPRRAERGIDGVRTGGTGRGEFSISSGWRRIRVVLVTPRRRFDVRRGPSLWEMERFGRGC